jgi:hypothetical protein
MARLDFSLLKGHGKLTSTRIALAFAVSVVADVLQLPINAATFTGVLAPAGEGADVIVDCVAAALTSALLGFHWALLPTFFVELVPGVDLAPTWTACVALVVYQRKLEQKNQPATERNVTGDKPLKVVTPLPVEQAGSGTSNRVKSETIDLEEVESPADATVRNQDRTRR